jgi:hypothetical protein
MKTIEHSLRFITEVNETHPTARMLLSLDEADQIAMLEGMLKELIAPTLQTALDEINKGGSWAILKVAK